MRAGAFARLAAILVAGYGALILLGLLAHESRGIGLALVVGGAAIFFAVRTRGDRAPTRAISARASVVALGGALAIAGIVGYNALARSDLSLPEAAILAYGALLLVASRHLHHRIGRADVATLVAWSLPLVAAPLGVFAVDAWIDARAGVGRSPFDAAIRHLLVAPLAATLQALQLDATAVGQSLTLDTPRGGLVLHVGVVCAGLQPGILFLGVFGLHAWSERTPARRLALLLALGLVGVYVANLLRLILLALVGYQWGGSALQWTHEHAGWALFVAWMIAFWWFVLRRLEGERTPPVGPPRA